MSDTTQHFYRGLKTFTGTGRVTKTAYWAFAELYLFHGGAGRLPGLFLHSEPPGVA